MNILESLNKQQRSAVEMGDGPTLIAAGPGTGKTKTLTARIVYLLQSGQAQPHEILALTFTVKAAQEMKQRIAAQIGRVDLPDILTFHALGNRILQRQDPSGDATFIAEPDRLALIRQLARDDDFKGTSTRELALALSRQKGTLQEGPRSIMKLLQVYNKELRARNLRDFDDLLSQTYQVLQNDPLLQKQLQSRYRYVLVDEFQDTNELQWQLVQLLRGTDNVFVIGDPKQSIYGFRGASAGMFGRFQADFPQHKLVALQTNYRSARRIVSLANQIFPGSEPLVPATTDEGEVSAIETMNEYSEADLVLEMIEQGIGGSNMLNAGESSGQRFRDFAVIYRTHHVAKTVQRRLHDSGIPIQIVGEGSPYERPEVRAVIDSLKWLKYREVLPVVKDFRRAQVQALLEGFDVSLSVSQLSKKIIAQLNLASDDRKQQQLEQLVGTLVRFDAMKESLKACLAYFDEIEQNGFYDPTADAVTLLTIHASKGLEFSHVMIIAAEEGALPHIRKSVPADIDEERRLFFVAVTRAKSQLHILHAKKRGGVERHASQFLTALSTDYLPQSTDPNSAKIEKRIHHRQQKARQATLF